MQLTNFSIREVVDAEKRDELNGHLSRERGDFVQTDPRVWLASFQIDGNQRVAGVRIGHQRDVSPDMIQLDIHLRVNEEEFDHDTFIPEATVADILALVSREVEKRLRF